MPHFVYALCDPSSDEPRYIGRTADPDRRLRSHWASRNEGCTVLQRWLGGLSRPPVMRLLEMWPTHEESVEAEAAAITSAVRRGWLLLNTKFPGGQGKRVGPEFVSGDRSGRALLFRFLKMYGVSNEFAAQAMRISSTAIHGWLVKGKRPGAMMTALIERWTSGYVPIDAWLTDAERLAIASIVPFRKKEAA